METTEIRTQIKEVIANATSIDVADIGDNASFEDELGLDSLTLLEIASMWITFSNLIFPMKNSLNAFSTCIRFRIPWIWFCHIWLRKKWEYNRCPRAL